jgi:hypothetical protein
MEIFISLMELRRKREKQVGKTSYGHAEEGSFFLY